MPHKRSKEGKMRKNKNMQMKKKINKSEAKKQFETVITAEKNRQSNEMMRKLSAVNRQNELLKNALCLQNSNRHSNTQQKAQK